MKVETKDIITTLKGKTCKNRTTKSKDSGLATTFLYLDGALVAKAMNKKKAANSNKQQTMKNRFSQLECMYKALSSAQLNALKEYTQYYNITHQTNITSAQLFKKLGMEYKLSDFLTSKLNAEYKAELISAQNEKITVQLITTNNPASKGLSTIS